MKSMLIQNLNKGKQMTRHSLLAHSYPASKPSNPTAASADTAAGADGSEKGVRQRGITREGKTGVVVGCAGADGSEKGVRQRGITREGKTGFGHASCYRYTTFVKRVVKRAGAGKKGAFRGNRLSDLQIHAQASNKRKGSRRDFVVLEERKRLRKNIPISERRLVNLALVEILLKVLVAGRQSENRRLSTRPLFLCLVGVSGLHIATHRRSPVLPA
jgi:hypothetical protein